jgi:hypothetical protein
MNTRKTLIAALVLSLGIASAVMYTSALQNQKNSTPEEIALNFLKNGATYGFDGIKDSISILDYYVLESYPVQHVVVISFDTAHAGWGDREGTFIAQVITNHVIEITIVEGEVVSAVIDDQWDELTQEQIIPEQYLELEEVRETVLDYVEEHYQIEFPGNWISTVTTPENLVGASTIQYISGYWTVTISYPVVQYPEYSVSIQNTSTGFNWSGTVTSSGEVTES